MALKVEIVSRETIKPSPPTPAHKRIHNLTLLDQTAPTVYIPLCLFYPPPSPPPSTVIALKASLSKALSLYYPLAGRFKDAATLECNDRGVDFVEARVPCLMADALHQHPDEDGLLPLLPCHPRRGCYSDRDGELTFVSLQLSTFDCGGVAIGICLWHGVADACTLACFLREWTRIISSSSDVIKPHDAVLDLSSLFPPRDPPSVETVLSKQTAAVTTTDTTTRRLVFEGSKIAALRREIEAHSSRPTRVEAVSALIWAAVIRISRPNHSSGSTDYTHVATMATNLRPRMVPQLPEQVMANAVNVPAVVEWDPVAADDWSSWYGVLAAKLREAVEQANDENARNILGRRSCNIEADGGGDVFMDLLTSVVDAYERGDMLGISSWCRFPFYETDFGWGKPVWLGFFTMTHNTVVLIDGEDGEGIEAWVAMSCERMREFVNSDAVLRYAYFKPLVI